MTIPVETTVPVAQYLRMSTEHQHYSLDNHDFATLKWPHFDRHIWPHPNR